MKDSIPLIQCVIYITTFQVRKGKSTSTQEVTTELLQSINENEKPIARGQFRKVMKDGNLPSEDEFAKLNRIDKQQNCLLKSKSIGLNFTSSKNPINR